MGSLGWPELLLIAVVLVVLFGSKKLPDTARALGRSMRIFKSETKALHDDDQTQASASAPQARQTPSQPVDRPAGELPAPGADAATTGASTTEGERSRKSTS